METLILSHSGTETEMVGFEPLSVNIERVGKKVIHFCATYWAKYNFPSLKDQLSTGREAVKPGPYFLASCAQILAEICK